MTSPCLETTPVLSLVERRTKLRAERYNTMLRQMEAEAAGWDLAAAHFASRIDNIDVRLRAIDEAGRTT